jgi:hypothetical protein
VLLSSSVQRVQAIALTAKSIRSLSKNNSTGIVRQYISGIGPKRVRELSFIGTNATSHFRIARDPGAIDDVVLRNL